MEPFKSPFRDCMRKIVFGASPRGRHVEESCFVLFFFSQTFLASPSTSSHVAQSFFLCPSFAQHGLQNS